MVEKLIRDLLKNGVDISFERIDSQEISSTLCENYKSVRGNSGECDLTGNVVDVMRNGCGNKYNCTNYNNTNGGMK